MEFKLRVLVAVRPEALSRIVEYLLRSLPSVEILSCDSGDTGLVRYAERILPHLIIINNRSEDPVAPETVATLKNASPGSKLILTSWHGGLTRIDRRCNADAHINEALLTEKLIPTVRRLCDQGLYEVSRRKNHRRLQ